MNNLYADKQKTI